MKVFATRVTIPTLVLALIGVIVFTLLNFARAQGLPTDPPTPSTNIITTQGAAWFALVALVAALGVPVTSRAVDFVLERSWGKWIQGDLIVLLSLLIATLWTLFVFQPGLLNISAFALLPTWQSIAAVSATIAISASGGKDSATRALRRAKLEVQK